MFTKIDQIHLRIHNSQIKYQITKRKLILESPNLLLDKIKIFIFDSHRTLILTLKSLVKNEQI